jgi:hypothetical protein
MYIQKQTDLEYRIMTSRYRHVTARTASPVRSGILTAVVVTISMLSDITQCSPLEDNRRFEGLYRLHLHAPMVPSPCWFLGCLIVRSCRWK